jgi:hypothetical protein
MSNKKKKKQKIQQEYFDLFTKDFQPDPNSEIIWEKTGITSFECRNRPIVFPNNILFNHPYIVFIIFVYLKNFPFFGRDEKILWEIPVLYKNTAFIFVYRKSGFQILSADDHSKIYDIALEAIKCINNTITYAESLIAPFLKEKIKKGAITIKNDYYNIRSRYTFFRNKAEIEHQIILERKIKIRETNYSVDDINEVCKFSNITTDHINFEIFYTIAMIDSYFSLLEHTLVLLIPFCMNIDYEKFNIEKFISLRWGLKYTSLLHPEKHKVFQDYFEKLKNIKEQLRNPLSHGNFLKKDYSFYIHMPHIGAIPARLTKSNYKFNFCLGDITPIDFLETLNTFDEFDNLLESNKLTKYGLQYIKNYLPVAFDHISKSNIIKAMSSEASFQKYIELCSEMDDMASNMEW